MEARMGMKCGLAAAVLAVAGGVFASTETDWSQKSGAVTIPAGETWYADESDMTAVNGLTSITVSGAVTGDNPVDAATLIFRDTTTPPKAGLLLGAGVVRKSGMSVWSAYANSQTSFTGDWHLDGGVVTNTAAGTFGSTAVGVKGKLYVHDGAALVANGSSVSYANREVHIAGAGNVLVPRALFVRSAGNAGLYRLFLDDDATFELGDCYWWLSYGAKLNLGGHTLTRYGTVRDWYFLQSTVTGTGSIFNKEGAITFREDSTWGGDAESSPFVFGEPGGTTAMKLALYNRTKVQTRPLQFNVPVVLSYSANNASGKVNLATTNIANFAGDVLLNGASSSIRSALNYDNVQVTFSGTISGDGSVLVGDGSYSRGMLCLAGHNTYQGKTALFEAGVSGILAYWPDSIPDYTKTTATNSFIAARLGMAADGITPRWGKSDFWNVMNTVDFRKLANFAIDASECEDSLYELDVSEIAANVSDPDRRRIGVAGGTLKLRVNAGDEQRIGLAAVRGRMDLVGGGTFRLAPTNALKGICTLDNANGWPIAEVRVTDGCTVIQNEEEVHVGGTYNPVNNKGYARLVVSNATWKTEFDTGYTSGTSAELGRGAIWVGRNNIGILEIQNGGSVSNKVVVSGGGTNPHEGSGSGAVYLCEGGRLYIPRKGNNYLTSCIGSATWGHGYLEQTGGWLGGNGIQIANYGYGVCHVYGGEAEFSSAMELACCNNGKSILYITNGTWRAKYLLRLCYGSSNNAQVTVDGPDAKLLVNGSDDGNIYMANNSDYIARINVNHGGLLEFGRMLLYDKGLLNKAVNVQPCVLNMNGGILKRRDGWCLTGMFGENATNRFSRVVVYEEGMTVDTNGREVRQIAEMPFEGADGNGIMRIDLGTEKPYLVGAPYVTIVNTGDGAGYGASAVADWDPKTRVLKGVHVTSHGWGYTQGKVKVTLSVGNEWSTSLTGDVITVGANVAGGFTKRGAGTLTLNATNTWAQWTKVEGGTLLANTDWAIPAGTAVTLSGGGVLDFNSKTGEVASVTYGVGGGSIINAANVVMPQGQAFALDVEDLLANRYVPMTGNIDLEGVEIRLTGDLNRLDPDVCRRHTLIAVSGGTASGTPVLVGSEVPEGWVLAVTGESVRLVRPCGFTVTVR